MEWLSFGNLWLEDEAVGFAPAEGKWPVLKQLVLAWADVDSDILAATAHGHWPLLEDLDPSYNPLNAEAM